MKRAGNVVLYCRVLVNEKTTNFTGFAVFLELEWNKET